jgi:MFS family permease
MALYLTMTGAPYLALTLGAGPVALGFLSLARALPYSLTTVWAGGLTDRRERLRLARGSLMVGAVAIAALAIVPSLALIYVLLGILGLALAFFWPAVQASLADAVAREVTGNLGWFNIGWSTGKAFGFLIGGFLLAGLGFGPVFALAALGVVGAGVLVMTVPPKPEAASGNAAPRVPGDASHPTAADVSRGRARRFRLAAWIGNSVAFGIGAVLNTHYPEWLEELGRGEALFGTYLGLIFGAQTLTFAVLARFTRWRFRAAPQVANYFASLFYSVNTPAGRGRNAGAHEALLGLGAMILPVAGGWAAAGLDRLEAPYLVAAGAGALALVAQLGILAGGRPQGRNGGAPGVSGVSKTPGNRG